MERIEINVETGEQTIVPFTPEEIAAIEAAAQPTPDALRAYAADKRWRVETGGCIVGSYPIATDRDSQTKLIAEMVALGAGLRVDPSFWKLRDGTFAVLSNAEMQAVIVGARNHIASAFAAEVAVLAAIKAGTITTFAAIDAAAWPQNS